MSKRSVFCIATSDAQAVEIVQQLKHAGFHGEDISVLFPDKTGTRDFAHQQKTKAPEGAVAGAGTGGVLGAALGWLAGIGALAIPGAGPFIAAGPIMSALSGAAVGAAVGGITGALMGMGIPEFEARRYEGKIRGGNILISVHSEAAREADQVRTIFEKAGAQDIASAGEASVKSRNGRARKENGQKKAKADPASSHRPTQEEIAERARQNYFAKGCPVGRDEEIWLEAEAELRAERSSSMASMATAMAGIP